jgi:serine/threonine-protein kinase
MSTEDATPLEEELASLLAVCDDVLAAGMAPAPLAQAGAPAEVRSRLERNLACMQLLRQMWSGAGAPTPTPVAAETPLPGSAATEPPLLKTLGRFEVRRELGHGGFGIVFLAHDPQLRREVALKVPRADTLVTAELRARFQLEARAAAGLEHSNIVPVYDAGESGALCYIASAYCPGPTLAQWLEHRAAPVPLREAAALVATLAEAMQHAHSRGVLHRDLKPSNILLTPLGDAPATLDVPLTAFEPKIADFGLAKLLAEAGGDRTQTGVVVGTPSYMAPEQAAGRTKDVGTAADIYALGAMLYELVTGMVPFRGANALEVLRQVESAEPAAPSKLRPGVPRDLDTICLKCLQKEPGRRYESAGALAEDLHRYLAGEPVQARPVGNVERLVRWCRRKPLIAGLTAALVLVFIGGFAGVLWQAQRAEQEKVVAQQERDEADKNFREVLRTIDRYCTQVSEDVLLNEPGMQPLRKKLLQAAQEYYRDFVRQRSDKPQLRVELGRSCGRLGRLTGDLDSWEQALPYFQEAVAIFQRLQEEDPQTAAFQLAAAWDDLGDWYLRGQRVNEAKAAFDAALRLADSLAAGQPASAGYQDQRASIHDNLGRLYEEQRQSAHAKAAYETARDLWLDLRQRHPDNLRYREQLGTVFTHLGGLYHHTGPMSQAETYFKSALAVRGPLAKENPGVVRLQQALATTHNAMGHLYYDMEQTKESVSALEKALEVYSTLAAQNPRVSRFEADQADVYNKLGATHWRGGDAAAAAQTHEKALAIRQRLADAGPQEALRQRNLAESCTNLALAYKDLDKDRQKPAEAEALFRKAILLLEPLVRDHDQLPDYRFRLALAQNNLGTLYRGQRRWQDAADAFVAASLHWDRLYEDHKTILDYQRFKAATRYNLGLTYQNLDDLELAVKFFRLALETYDKLSQDHPKILDFAIVVCRIHGRLGDNLRDQHQPEAALPWFERGRDKLELLLQQNPKRPDTRQALRNIHWGWAMALGDLDRHSEAAKEWEQALAMDAGPYKDEIRLRRATAQARAGDYMQALTEADTVLAGKALDADVFYHAAVLHVAAAIAVDKDEKVPRSERATRADRYAVRAVELLDQALAAGYVKTAKELDKLRTNKALELLWPRQDFQRVMSAMEQKLAAKSN